MKAVLISIRPKWCELIASGKKTIEVRKTAPKIPTPFKCYMYMSAYHWAFGLLRELGMEELADRLMQETGTVIGEFVCDKIYKFSTRVYLGGEQTISDEEIVSKSCVSRQELRAYEGQKQGIFGWHISNLVIYDKPMKLNDFMRKPCDFAASCGACGHAKWLSGYRFDGCELSVTRPPQSWCHVEAIT